MEHLTTLVLARSCSMFDGTMDQGSAWAVIAMTIGLWAILRCIFLPTPKRRTVPVGATKSCSSCRTSHPRFARFCRSCGTEL